MKILTTLFFSLFLLQLSAQDKEAAMQNIRVDVVYLASDLLEGRETGTKGEALAAQYIATRMKNLGVTPKGNDGTYYNPFDFTFKPNPHAEEGEPRTGKNVVGFIDNGAASTVVIGGHYDHLGMGEFGSLHAGEAGIHNGADDNASGIAAMLLIAETLKNSDLKNNNYLFIAFSGEELGLYGSKKYVKNPTVALDQMNYVINMDMVGRLNEERVLAINGTGTSPVWNDVIPAIKVADIKAKLSDSGIGPSDHTSFYLEDIPALHFFTGQHNDYHKPGDDAHLVNFDGIYDVAQFIVKIVEELDDDGKLEFTKTKQTEERQAAAFKVSLGVMPDYVYDGTGMRIDGVTEERPAANAGIEKGDVVIKIGEIEVKDIYDYMEGLSKYKKGDTVTVKVKRGNKVLKKKVTF